MGPLLIKPAEMMLFYTGADKESASPPFMRGYRLFRAGK